MKAKFEEKFIVINKKYLTPKYIPENLLFRFSKVLEELQEYLSNKYNQDEKYRRIINGNKH